MLSPILFFKEDLGMKTVPKIFKPWYVKRPHLQVGLREDYYIWYNVTNASSKSSFLFALYIPHIPHIPHYLTSSRVHYARNYETLALVSI